MMGRRYSDIAFTPAVRAIQGVQGSRDLYARYDALDEPGARLGPGERAFIAARDGFYIATVSRTGWPYVQFRGGPPGFLRVLGEAELGFADYRGNRQYVTTGNVAVDDRVSLFLMDDPARRRLKLFGRMRGVDRSTDPEQLSRLAPNGYRAVIERAFLIRVEAFDWNCPQHITPRFTSAEIALEPEIRDRICAETRERTGRPGSPGDGTTRVPGSGPESTA
jgi:predicted pyridoxine 5'-phosphate oxidase superfamily flavin-nucleotide-binding protein